jgi:hypothetical protein
MPGLLNTASTLMCLHGGTVSIITPNTRALAGGAPLVRASDTFLIAGCAFAPGGVAHPCVRVQWVQPAARSRVLSDPTLTEASVGLCVAADNAVQGVVQIVSTQSQASGL